MFKDDRMMSMLTLVLVMAALGAVIQRVDVVSRFFGDGPVPLELRSDEVIVRANELTAIDVLGNDAGLNSGDTERLLIAEQPACGRVFVREGKAHYLPAERCAGPQRFRYVIAGRNGPVGDVIAVVQLDDPAQSKVTANAQRDITTPTPAASRPAVTRGTDGPSALPEQSGAAEALTAAPTVPRPQTSQAADLAQPSAATAQADGAGLTPDGAGATPRIAEPGEGLGASAALPGSGALDVSPLDSTASAPLPAPGPGLPAGPDSAPVAIRDPMPDAAAASQTGGTALRPPDTGIEVRQPAETPDMAVARDAPAAIVSPGESSGAADQGVGQPAAALRDLLTHAGPAALAPVDSTPPPALAEPRPGGLDVPAPAQSVSPAPSPLPAQSASPKQPGTPEQPAPPAQSASPEQLGMPEQPTTPEQPASPAQPAPLARTAEPAEPCDVPPALTLDIRPGGETVVSLDAPCDAGGVAQLGYDTLEFGIALDSAGIGAVTVPGLQPSSDAELRLPGGDGLAFDLPFSDTGRIDRIAMVWDTPVQLDLHAFEFGALPGSDGHVRPGRPRSFDQVRRRGGGYLLSYAPVGGVGEHISVYTYWRRPGSGTGVVKLKVDFANRTGGGQSDTCGTGALAQPDFRVLHSRAGRVAPPGLRRLAPLDCAGVAQAERLIGDAVDDIVILRR